MSNPIRRRLAAAGLGLMVGLAGFGSIAVAHRPPGCDNGQAVGNPHCDDDHDDHDNGNGNGGGHHHHGGSLISIDLGDIDLDVLEIAISKVLAVVDVDVLEVEDVTVLAKDVIDVMADANIQDVTGVDLDAAIVTVLHDVASGELLSNNTVTVQALVHGVANDVINISQVGVAAVAAVSDTDVLSDNNINVLGCQINSEDNNGGQFNGEGNDGNNCGLLAGVGLLDGDLLGDDLLGDDLLEDGVLAVLLAGDADASITAGVLGLF